MPTTADRQETHRHQGQSQKADQEGAQEWQAWAVIHAGRQGKDTFSLLWNKYKSVLRIRDVYPWSRILIFTHSGSRISDPGCRIQKQQQKRGVKKISRHTFFCSHKFHKI